ncbi:MAG: SPOR domain-containing protein [Flavobacteriales bacterium]|nr:SPOR domain-containing protein [Flavobacteriales bacterium]MDG1765592.1 SPOR domain-containing protein [Flavobacteriales bacterium]
MKRILIIPLCLFISLSISAQDDAPWWKNMFRKEAVNEAEKTQDATPIDMPVDSINNTNEVIDSLFEETPAEELLVRPGQIKVEQSPLLTKLDSLYKENPPRIMGYRIKIYFGNLQEARGIKANHVSSGNREGCYVKQYPPNFAVVVGNFRTEEAAQQRLQELKQLYPGATVVRDEIESIVVE